MTKDEALKMAIEAMEQYVDVVGHKFNAETWGDIEDKGNPAREAINACKEALEQPAQEPIGWNEEEFNKIAYSYRICPAHKVNMVSERYQELVDYVLSLKDKNT